MSAYIFDKIEEEILSAIESAKLTNASFGFPNDRITVTSKHFGVGGVSMHPTEYIKDAVKLHHGSWIISPLERALAIIRQNKELIEKCEKLQSILENNNFEDMVYQSKGGKK